MLYTKPLEDLVFTDVEAFVGEKHRESETLDYKQSWPRDLPKVIAAMANTYGGLVLVGVSEEDNTGLPDQIVGVPVKTGIDALRQRVISLAYDAVYPPIVPQVEAYALTEGADRAVVVIRVAQSDQTPHAVDGRRKIYVRVDSQSRPSLYRLATIGEIEWLLDQRRRGEEFLVRQITAAQDRADEVLSGKLMYRGDNRLPTLDAWVAPRFYSGEEFLSPGDAKSLLKDRLVHTSIMYQPSWGFPYSNGRRSVPRGYCAYTKQAQYKDYSVYEYFELNTSGILYTKTRMICTGHEAWEPILPLDWVLCQLDGLLRFAVLSYEMGRLCGLVQVRASLSALKSVVLRGNQEYSYNDLQEKHRSLDNDIDVLDRVLNVFDLDQIHTEIVKEAAESLLWAFGYDWDEGAFEQWWKYAWKN